MSTPTGLFSCQVLKLRANGPHKGKHSYSDCARKSGNISHPLPTPSEHTVANPHLSQVRCREPLKEEEGQGGDGGYGGDAGAYGDSGNADAGDYSNEAGGSDPYGAAASGGGDTWAPAQSTASAGGW